MGACVETRLEQRTRLRHIDWYREVSPYVDVPMGACVETRLEQRTRLRHIDWYREVSPYVDVPMGACVGTRLGRGGSMCGDTLWANNLEVAHRFISRSFALCRRPYGSMCGVR